MFRLTTLSIGLGLVLAVPFANPAYGSETDPLAEIRAEFAARAVALEAQQQELSLLAVKMHDEMEQIRNARDEAERIRLMEAHRTTMLEVLELVRAAGGDEAFAVISDHLGRDIEGRQPAEKAAHTHKRIKVTRRDLPPDQRLDELETRVDMMLIVIEDMIENAPAH